MRKLRRANEGRHAVGGVEVAALPNFEEVRLRRIGGSEIKIILLLLGYCDIVTRK